MTTKMSWEEEPTCVIPRHELVRLLSLSRLIHPRLRPATPDAALRLTGLQQLPCDRDELAGNESLADLRQADPAPPPEGSGTAVRSPSHLATTLVTFALTLGACVTFGMLLL